jgi:hypothetical protein
MSTHQPREGAQGRQQSPSMSELLASCAAADAVSTPPDEAAEPGEGRDDGPDLADGPAERRAA